jgi:hypothetical protein
MTTKKKTMTTRKCSTIFRAFVGYAIGGDCRYR